MRCRNDPVTATRVAQRRRLSGGESRSVSADRAASRPFHGGDGMTTGGWIFLMVSWAVIIGASFYSFRIVLRSGGKK